MGIIAVAGRKGGIGKSTIAGNLAGEFVDMGRSVIVLDADPQHSLAAWASQGEGTLAKCIERIHKGDSDELKTRARKAAGKADIVVIDTPPGMTDTLYEAAMARTWCCCRAAPRPSTCWRSKMHFRSLSRHGPNGARRSRASD